MTPNSRRSSAGRHSKGCSSTLGWTLAYGSARLAADMNHRKPEANEASAFALRRAA
jgi:hypothetical protein